MNTVSEIEFVVDEQYENEKGVFTVLSIHRNEMVIRWESGEEIRTDIELQRNIQARRQWEQMQADNVAKSRQAGTAKSGSAKGPESFEGFQASDFKNSASGTRWRGRNQLGGQVTRRLPESRFDMNSWALGNKPEMHWLDMQHQKNGGIESGAKFFVRVNQEGLLFGLSIVQPDSESENGQCWRAFTDWLSQEENHRQLLDLAGENKLTVRNRADAKSKVLMSKDGGWFLEDDQGQTRVESFSAYAESISKNGAVNLEISRHMDKKEALTVEKSIAGDIANLFARLMPLYNAAWPVLV